MFLKDTVVVLDVLVVVHSVVVAVVVVVVYQAALWLSWDGDNVSKEHFQLVSGSGRSHLANISHDM